jgi:hypothetical protein
MLEEQRNKTAKLFQFTATSNNPYPWDEVQFTVWKHSMVLSPVRLTLRDDTSMDIYRLLLTTG